MPLTFAHPAAVIPLQRVLRQWVVPSALVIGSVTPDLAYVLPFGVSRNASHNLGALLWFCLPVGYCVYLIFHLVLKRPLISLFPTAVARRLSVFDAGPHRLPGVPWWVVPTSLLLGAVTHLGWDAFTHDGAPAVRALAFLRAPPFSIGSHRVFVYKILQHGSTLLGSLILVWWALRWLREAPIGPEPRLSLAPSERVIGVATLLGVPAVCGFVSALFNLWSPVTGLTVQVAVGRGVLSSFSALCIVLLAFGAWWHVWPRRGPTTARSSRTPR